VEVIKAARAFARGHTIFTLFVQLRLISRDDLVRRIKSVSRKSVLQN